MAVFRSHVQCSPAEPSMQVGIGPCFEQFLNHLLVAFDGRAVKGCPATFSLLVEVSFKELAFLYAKRETAHAVNVQGRYSCPPSYIRVSLGREQYTHHSLMAFLRC